MTTTQTTEAVGWVCMLRVFAEDGSVAAMLDASLKFSAAGDFDLHVWDHDGNQLRFDELRELIESSAGWDTIVEVVQDPIKEQKSVVSA